MIHTPTNCAAQAAGACERLHLNQRVALYGRREQTGTVVNVVDEVFYVRFDNGDELGYYESELVELDHKGAMLAIVTEVLADPEWTARVVVAALAASDHRDHPAFDILSDAFTKKENIA